MSAMAAVMIARLMRATGASGGAMLPIAARRCVYDRHAAVDYALMFIYVAWRHFA